MHPPRIPLDFSFHPDGYGAVHIASGDTGKFWFGLILMLGMLWNLWLGLRKDGSFGRATWISPPADRDHPLMYWFVASIYFALMLGGIDLVVAGLIGSRPLVFG
jgi:hypothetical protein